MLKCSKVSVKWLWTERGLKIEIDLLLIGYKSLQNCRSTATKKMQFRHYQISRSLFPVIVIGKHNMTQLFQRNHLFREGKNFFFGIFLILRLHCKSFESMHLQHCELESLHTLNKYRSEYDLWMIVCFSDSLPRLLAGLFLLSTS